MPFVLSTDNVQAYLFEQDLVPAKNTSYQVERRDYKNFNLWFKQDDASEYLVKQERFDWQGETSGDLAFEWRIQQLLADFPQLAELRPLMSELLLYDPEQSILVSRYFPDYEDLEHLYEDQPDGGSSYYAPAIARAVGRAIAQVHRLTWNPDYESFLSQFSDGEPIEHQPRLLRQIDSITPEIFTHFSRENLEFFRIYQNSPKLQSAVQSLRQHWQACCLIHRDLRLSNLLIHTPWVEQNFLNSSWPPVRIIDWEKFAWGDPAYDLGTLIAHHLRLWLGSLAIHRELPLAEALRLAHIPLEVLQPSLVALIAGYGQSFTQIFRQDSQFLERVLRFTGLVLIEKVLLKLEHRNPFGNTDLCAMQVAQVLLDRPKAAAQQIFGIPFDKLVTPQTPVPV